MASAEQGLQAVTQSPTPTQLRSNLVAQIQAAQGSVNQIKVKKGLVDQAVTDTSDPALTQIQTQGASDFQAAFFMLGANANEAIEYLAQLIADISEQAGVDGGANELRVFRGNASPTKVSVSQDA